MGKSVWVIQYTDVWEPFTSIVSVWTTEKAATSEVQRIIAEHMKGQHPDYRPPTTYDITEVIVDQSDGAL